MEASGEEVEVTIEQQFRFRTRDCGDIWSEWMARYGEDGEDQVEYDDDIIEYQKRTIDLDEFGDHGVLSHGWEVDPAEVRLAGYVTKDSGVRAEYASGMVRDTQDGKPRFGLTMPRDVPYSEQLLTRFAELMGRGAAKYSARNWELGSGEAELERARESALRHLFQWYHGETDEDHAAAVLFNLTSAEYYKWRLSNAQPED